MITPSSEMLNWIDQALETVGQARHGAVEMVRDAARSTVFRIPCNRGRCYFKVDHFASVGEGAIVFRLTQLVPEHVAEVIAFDSTSGWLLSRDMGDCSLDTRPEPDWLACVRALATLQRATSPEVEEWLKLGAPDWRGEALVARIDRLIADTWMLRPGEPDGITTVHYEHICSRRDLDVARVRRLAEDAIPAALVHQDVVGENVVWAAHGPCFIDWSDAVVAHPFYACDRLLDAHWSDRAWRERIIGAYLEPFEDLAPASILRTRFDDVLQMRALYEGLRWHREITKFGHEHPQSHRLRRDVVAGMTMVAEFDLRRASTRPADPS